MSSDVEDLVQRVWRVDNPRFLEVLKPGAVL